MKKKKKFPEEKRFARKDLAHFIHKWVGEVCEQFFSRDPPLLVRGMGMVLQHWGTKVGQGDFSCNKLEIISPGSVPHTGWRGCLERESKILLKCGMIAYRTKDMRGLISVAETPRTSALAQVTIRPGSATQQVERVAGEGIKNSVEMRDDYLSNHRHARTILHWSDASDLCPLPGHYLSRLCPPTGWEGGWRGNPACYWNATQYPRTEDMYWLFSVPQTPRTSALSPVPEPVATFSKHPIPTNANNGQDKYDNG